MKISTISKVYIIFIIFNIMTTPIILCMDKQMTLIPQPGFLSSAIESTAGIVAIAFAISILVVQHAASNYAPIVLSNFRNDRKFWFTISYCIFTIIFLSFSLVLNWKILLLDLFYFGNTLGLLAIFFLYTFERINPIFIVNNIRNDIIDECNTVSKKIKIIIKESLKKKKVNYKNSLNTFPPIIIHTELVKHSELILKIKTYELTLRQIVLESNRKGDYDTCRIALNSYPILFESYLKIVPDYYWPEDEFLSKRLEGIKTYYIFGLKNNDYIFLEEVISIIGKLGISFIKNTKPLGALHETSWLVSLSIYYLQDIAMLTCKNEMWDISSNAIKEIGNIGKNVLTDYHNDHLSIYYMLPIAKLAIQKNEFYLPKIVTSQSFEIIQYMIRNLRAHYTIESEIEDITKMLSDLAQSRVNKLSFMGLFSDISTIGPIPCVLECLHIKNTNYDTIETHFREELEKNIVDSIINLVGTVGRDAILSGDVVFAKVCADSLVLISGLIVKEEFITIQNKHNDELRHIFTHLSSLHFYDDTSNRLYDTEIVERIVEVILYCLKNNYNDIGKNGINTVSNLALNVLKNDTSGYSAIRTIRKLDIIGCYGVAENKHDISKLVAEKYLDFEKKFQIKFNKIPEDTANIKNRYFVNDFDKFSSKYKPVEELSHIMNPNNGNKFEEILSKIRKDD
ncbi:membrane hypothetical protein [metagenome]